MKRSLLLAVLALAVGAPVAAAQSYTKPPVVVADGLNNPRGMAFGPDASLYVAEAGTGGSNCIKGGPCVGSTGSIARIAPDGTFSRLATGLLSGAEKDGTFAVGADDVSVDANGRIFTIISSAGKQLPPGLTASQRRQSGRVLRIYTTGRYSPLGRVDQVEYLRNPDGDKGRPDSNPYSIAATPGRQYVTDAAGNTLLEVRGQRVRLLRVFPDAAKGADSVPTVVRIGPDGALYVAELSGERAPNGKSRVWRISGSRRTVYARGLSRITGMAFGPDGSLFVSEFSTNFAKQSAKGRIVRIARDGTRSIIGAAQLRWPAGIAVEPEGRLYVSNWSTLPGTAATAGPFRDRKGQILRFDP